VSALELGLLNLAAWSVQAGVLALSAAALARLAPIERPGTRLALGQALLALVVGLPLVQPWHSAPGRVGWALALAPLVGPSQAPTPEAAAPLGTPAWPVLVAGLLVAGWCLHAARLGAGLFRLRSLRRRAREWAAPPWLAAARDEIAPRARFLLSDEVSTPATCGLRRPIVLLPAGFAALDRGRQGAIATHELLHARRGDWLPTLLEELLKAALFFHPAVHWLVGRVRLAREQAVDAAVVRRLGARELYLESLVAAARAGSRRRLVPAAPFFRESHLRERVDLLLKEVAMSRVRTLAHLGVSAVAILLAVSWAVSAAPLQAPTTRASVATADEVQGPAPKIVHKVNPSYPADAKAEGVEGLFVIDLTIGKEGAVRDARVVASAPDKDRLKDAMAHKGSPQAILGDARLAAAALDAVRAWTYEPVLKDGRPVEVRATVTVNFRLS